MVLFIPQLDYRNLLPPLLACLPTAFASPQAPSTLLPLLSPILRHRVQLLSSTHSSPSDSWLSLLCWKSDEAEKLISLIKSDVYELHPVSGEVEFGDVDPIKYRQPDEETLQANVRIPDLGLAVRYLWCQEDQDGGGDGWRVLNLAPFASHDETDTGRWFDTTSDAVESVGESTVVKELESGPARSRISSMHEANNDNQRTHEVDDDDHYWAQYNNKPGRSSELNRPSATQVHIPASKSRIAMSESEYFARYRQVQPEMDNDDPSQDHNALGDSTLVGDVMMTSMQQTLANNSDRSYSKPIQSKHGAKEDSSEINHPRASSPPTRSIAVPRLEESAASQSLYEVVIRQHVSTTIKSLFRLTRGAGMDRDEFDELIRTELDTLGMMTEGD